MKKYEVGLRFAAMVIVVAAAPTVAMAYIDPGNGSYMVQALFTVVGVALFYLRHPIRSMKDLWHWFSSRNNHTSSQSAMDASSRPITGNAHGNHGLTATSESEREQR